MPRRNCPRSLRRGRRALAASRDLDSLATLRLSAITFVLEFHVEVEDGGIETLESCELLGNVDPEMIRHFHVASFDDDFGVVRARSTWSLRVCGVFVDENRGLRRGRHSYLPINGRLTLMETGEFDLDRAGNHPAQNVKYHLPPVTSGVNATLVRNRSVCHCSAIFHRCVVCDICPDPANSSRPEKPPEGLGRTAQASGSRRDIRPGSPPELSDQAAATTNTAPTCTPSDSRTRTASAEVAPVVTTSSTRTTSAPMQPSLTISSRREADTQIRPARLSCRCAADSPTESRTPRRIDSAGQTWQPVSSRRAAACVDRSTGSPPRVRAVRARVGAGTSTSGASCGGSNSPQRRSVSTASASAAPSGAARSRRPRSFAAITARRRGPAYGPSAHTGTPGSTRGCTATGSSDRVRLHRSHHPEPGSPQPPHSAGRTRSRSARMPGVCPVPPTSADRHRQTPSSTDGGEVSPAAPGPHSSRSGPEPHASTGRRPGRCC